MEFEVGVRYLSMTLEVLLLDLLLSSDNIVMIALACRSLPPAKRKLGLVLGTGMAILLRVVLTTGARFVLELPVLKVLGGLALVVIAIKLIWAADTPSGLPEGKGEGGTSLWSAVATIIIADLFMSVDNVLGLAVIARGSVLILVLGLIISVPLLMFGSLFVGALLQRYPVLIRAGGAMLGWFAGDIAVSDPIFSQWISQQAPALTFVVPLLAAGYVLAQVAVMRETRFAAATLRPEPRIKASIDPTKLGRTWFAREHRLAPATIERTSAVEISPDHPEPEPDAVRLETSRKARFLAWAPWPDRADWRIFERWSIGSLGATGLLLFALRPRPALATVLGVVAVLGMTLAPKAHATMRRNGWRHAVAIAVVCVGLAGITAILILLFRMTGWLGPVFR